MIEHRAAAHSGFESRIDIETREVPHRGLVTPFRVHMRYRAAYEVPPFSDDGRNPLSVRLVCLQFCSHGFGKLHRLAAHDVGSTLMKADRTHPMTGRSGQYAERQAPRKRRIELKERDVGQGRSPKLNHSDPFGKRPDS